MKIDGQSKLKSILACGSFAVTAECGPPRGANAEVIHKKGELLKGCVDAVNVTDNHTAVVRMSSLAACLHLLELGIEPVMQMVTRDRNRIALQSDIIGAYSLGIRNMLCLSGDHQSLGSQPEAMNVFDIDSVNLLHAVRVMRDEGKDMSGFALNGAPEMFIGAAENPFADPLSYRVVRLGKKIAAGVDFVQTQCVYNLPRFKEWMRMAREEGLTEKVYIMAGITPLKSAKMAQFMVTKVAGMDVPEAIIKRMSTVTGPKVVEEGLKIARETIAELRAIPGVRGIHIMAIEAEERVPELVQAAGLLPRPQI
jgi:methylenetetrahydrofolate reductase (NADPH)